ASLARYRHVERGRGRQQIHRAEGAVETSGVGGREITAVGAVEPNWSRPFRSRIRIRRVIPSGGEVFRKLRIQRGDLQLDGFQERGLRGAAIVRGIRIGSDVGASRLLVPLHLVIESSGSQPEGAIDSVRIRGVFDGYVIRAPRQSVRVRL